MPRPDDERNPCLGLRSIRLALRHLPIPPSAIPVKLNYQYFSLNQAGLAWEASPPSRAIITRW